MDNTQIDIEIQLIDQKNIVERMLYYMSKMYVEPIKAGGKYKDLKKTIVIGILDFDYFHIEKMSLLDEAEERGLKKGIEQGKIDMAKEMILDGENIEKIKKYSKLSEKDIEKLRRELMPQ